MLIFLLFTIPAICFLHKDVTQHFESSTAFNHVIMPSLGVICSILVGILVCNSYPTGENGISTATEAEIISFEVSNVNQKTYYKYKEKTDIGY